MQFVPESWRDYKSSLNSPSSPSWANSAAPDIGQAPGSLPAFDDLRDNKALDTRRKANAVFVVLGEFPHVSAHRLAQSLMTA